MSRAPISSHATSAAGLITMQSNAEAQVLPSSTAADFHTPMQTPVTQCGPGQAETPKKKKKKPKKKKKQAAAEGSGSGSEQSKGWHDPFDAQMSYIDAIKQGGRNEDHYSNRRDDATPGRTEKVAKMEGLMDGSKVCNMW
ncbi:hypothetical protein P153DRAFT_365770 [Dothidotthia symphoricarpi CBS 119687]|uniref:Uncharacterized protein n=1 Tax=Dothidotthia symphoricarpi CBS 119687 TaxID=1392245 RepID=A0A6A6AIW9_9PLEO|nr:uncharacterized protein P153DRAFT_365770 [Dothidotthia symphoricarpi CBS 119687]KAF2131173.1 hypothetical protein P153DRAFT_365770 [Dothidotthia symphoricarpi CBS 119687]